MKSTLMFNNFSHITYGKFSEYGELIGHSEILSMKVTGDVKDDGENVVVDFGTCKSIVDDDILNDYTYGLDHKIVVNTDIKNITLQAVGEKLTQIDSPFYTLLVPNEVVFKIDNTFNLTDFVNQQLKERFNAAYVVDIKPESDYNNISANYGIIQVSPFSYVHGLRASTSKGCRNIAHGHNSLVGICASSNATELPSLSSYDMLSNVIAYVVGTKWDNKMYVWSDNLLSDKALKKLNPDGLYTHGIQYKDLDKRVFTALVKNPDQLKILDTETTCEFLTEFIAKDVKARWLELEYDIKELEKFDMYVSEGRQKGCMISFKDVI